MDDFYPCHEVVVARLSDFSHEVLQSEFGLSARRGTNAVLLPRRRFGRHSGLSHLTDHVNGCLQSWSVEPPARADESVQPDTPKAGEPRRCVTVNLAEHSAFHGLKGRRYFGTTFDTAETNRHHSDGRHQYLFDHNVLESDVLISVASAHCESKAGLAAGMWSLLRLTANSNWLPHQTLGTPKTGGDSCPDNSVRSRLKCAVLSARTPPFLRSVRPPSRFPSGDWWGNDTVWRTILDLNRALLFSRADGTLAEDRQRATFSVVEVPAVGNNEGTDLVVAGWSLWAVDLVCAKLMGLNWQRIPHLSHVFDDHDRPLADFGYDSITVRSDIAAFNRPLVDIDDCDCFQFPPPPGWAELLGGSR